MVRIGWLPLVELLINDASFGVMLIVLIIAVRRKRSAPLILLTFAVGIYVALRLVEWLWQIAFDHQWIDASSIKSIYWTWASIAKSSIGIAFTIGFCWSLLAKQRTTT